MSENKQFYIHTNGQRVPVTEEIYLAYYRSIRRDRYYECDLKTESAVRDKDGKITAYRPSKEDSLERLQETGKDYADEGVSIEDAVIRAFMADKLYEALGSLPERERELIEALFFSNGGNGMTERDYAAVSGIPQKTINDRKKRILAKLKKLFGN
jgi:RNA polymerase sigma factor (sigma-70 family)